MVKYSFWWTCFWWRHHFRSTSNFRSSSSLDAFKLPFCSISLLSFVHSEPINGLKNCVYGPVHLRVMLNIFCSNNIVSFLIWFLLCFFRLCYWRLFLVCFVEMKMGGGFVPTLWFGLKILNLIFFLDWRSRFFSSDDVLLDAYLHSIWLIFILVFLERVRCVDAFCWR